jgi:hypothetical protein
MIETAICEEAESGQLTMVVSIHETIVWPIKLAIVKYLFRRNKGKKVLLSIVLQETQPMCKQCHICTRG